MKSKVFNEETVNLMLNWVRWSHKGTLQIYGKLWYSQVSIQGKQVKTTDIWIKTPTVEPVNEQDAQQIEDAVTRLASIDMRLAKCIVFRWIFGYKLVRLSKTMHMSRDVADNLLMQAESTLNGLLWAN